MVKVESSNLSSRTIQINNLMELATFKIIVDIGISLYNVTRSLTGHERRKTLGNWMQELGVLVEEIAVKLELGEFPYTTCARMSYMVDHFSELMDGHLDEQEIKSLHTMLVDARNIERLYGEISQLNPEQKAEKIIALKEVAGTLQAAGNMMIIN